MPGFGLVEQGERPTGEFQARRLDRILVANDRDLLVGMALGKVRDCSGDARRELLDAFRGEVHPQGIGQVRVQFSRPVPVEFRPRNTPPSIHQRPLGQVRYDLACQLVAIGDRGGRLYRSIEG